MLPGSESGTEDAGAPQTMGEIRSIQARMPRFLSTAHPKFDAHEAVDSRARFRSSS